MPETFSTFNSRAATASSVLTAAVVCLALGLALLGLRSQTTENSAGVPAGPQALPAETLAFVAYENPEIEARATEALDQISYAWRDHLPGWKINFLPSSGRVSGYTWSQQLQIEVFVKDGDDPERIARVLAHELGHAVDVTLNSPDERRAWLAQRDSVSQPWWPTSGAADFETGAGDFAEVFAAWQIGDADFRSKLGASPSQSDLDLMQHLAHN